MFASDIEYKQPFQKKMIFTKVIVHCLKFMGRQKRYLKNTYYATTSTSQISVKATAHPKDVSQVYVANSYSHAGGKSQIFEKKVQF